MKKILLLCLFVNLVFYGFAADFFWVGNGGNWSDYNLHWATSSNGTIMHTRVPDVGDNVYFDQHSFSSTGQVVVVDTTFIACDILNWQDVTNQSEFLSSSSDTLLIANQLVLAGTTDMSFNFFGTLIFKQLNPGQTLTFNPVDHIIVANVLININAGVINVASDLKMSSRRLIVFDGELNMNSNNLYVQHFNADSVYSNPVAVINPALSNADTLVCFGSLHFLDELDISSFSGLLNFKSNAADSNYVNIEAHSLNSEILFSSGKKYFLLSNLVTSKALRFPMAGHFFSQGHNIFCSSFDASDPYNRTIDLGTSEIHTPEFILETFGLNLISETADLVFEGAQDLTFYTNKPNLKFKTLSVDFPGILSWDGSIEIDTISLIAGTRFYLTEASMLTFLDLVATGNCGEYIELRALCTETNLYDESCVSILPVFKSTNPITAEYIKISNIKADGSFSLSNSFDEGGNEGWTITEPTDISTLYWIGNTGNWNTSGNWSASSGGVPQNCIPTKKTHVVFDNFSFAIGDTLLLDDYGYCASMNWEAINNNVAFDGVGKIYITDSIALNSLLSIDFSGDFYLENNNPNDTIPIKTNGVVINAPVFISGQALWDFIDAAVINNVLVFESGKIEFSGNDILVDNFISNNNNPRFLNITNTNFQLTGDGVVWDLEPINLGFVSTGSNLSIIGSSQSLKVLKGAGQTYNNIDCDANFVEITGSNWLSILKIAAGNTVRFESGSVCHIDSIDASADCTQRISLLSDLYDSPASIYKTGHDTLMLDNFFIKNIIADTTGAKYYEASNTIRSGNVDGWIFSDTVPGKTYKWKGQTADWNNLNNWEVDGLTATCLPTINDTVIIDPVDFSTALIDTIKITTNAFCHDFIANGIVDKALHVRFEQNLNIAKSLMLSDSVAFNYATKPSFGNVSEYNYGVFIVPDSVNFILNPQAAKLNVNLYSAPSNLTDTVLLDSDLIMDSTSGLFVLSGLFQANQKNIQCGYFKTESTSNKEIDIQNSNLNIIANLEMQDNSVLNFSADSSSISFLGNSEFFSSFDGGSQQYFDVLFSGTTNDEDKDLLVFVAGENTFNVFKGLNGVNIFVEAGKTQVVDSALIIRGTCQNYASLNSSEDGVTCIFDSHNVVNDTITCVSIADCQIIPQGVAMLSENLGNNVGWIFNMIPAASASFDIPYPACISSAATFTNTSESMWGASNNLIYQWIIENQDTTNTEHLTYTFDTQGEYTINLTTTDTITGCYDTFSDNLEITNHWVNISSSVPGLAFCQGTPVTFTAISDLATEFYFYHNNVWVNLGDPIINEYTSNTLQNEDSIKVVAVYNGCTKTSNTLEMTVYPTPTVSLSCSEIDTTVCEGEPITFTASGADLYEFFVDGVSVAAFSANNIFTVSTLTNGQVISVHGKSISGCIEISEDVYTVSVVPNPSILLSSVIDPPEICAGEMLSVNASGADLYEFFVNGVSQGAASANNTFESTGLTDGNILTAMGYDSNSCSDLSNSIEISVNPMPETILTSSEADLEICTGENVVFTGSGAVEYQFFIDNTPQGAYSDIETLSTSSLNHNQTISLVGRIGNCYDTVDNDITISVYPLIELIASTDEICPGENIDFTASGDTIYQFFVDGTAVTALEPNAILSSSLLTNLQQVSVQGTPGACLPSPITIVVNPTPSINLLCSETDNTICSGDLITFSANGAHEYEFFVDGFSQGPASQTSQFTTNALVSGQTITVSGYSEFGCFNNSSDSYTITVFDYPNVSLSSSEIDNQICEGDAVEFTASGADEYQFLISGVPQGDFSTEQILSISDISNGSTISVQGISNECIAIAPETYNYTVFSLPNVSLSPISPISVCESELITVQANGATEYEFFINSISQGVPSSNNIFESTNLNNDDVISVVGYQNICSSISPDIITVNVNQIPEVVLTSDIPVNGICYGDTVEFFVSGAMSYQFYLDNVEYGDITTNNSIIIPELENNQIIDVVGYNNACFSPAENNITVAVNYVSLELSSNVTQNTLCSGEDVTVTATGSDIYEFFLDGISLGIPNTSNNIEINNIENGQSVSVEGTDNETGCKSRTEDYYFTVSEIPLISVGSDTQFCQYDSVVLTTSTDYDLQWTHNSENIDGANHDVYTAYAGGLYSVFTISGQDGGVFSSGANAYGQLGNGNNIQSIAANKASLNEPIKMITTGADFEIALTESGNLMAWGNNDWGNLGIGTYSPVYTPVQIGGISNVIEICAGHKHVLAIMNDSTLMSWGQNNSGQLGYGNNASGNFPMPVPQLDSISSLAAGRAHSLALTVDGNIYTWGLNNFGQLGLGNLESVNEPMLVEGIDSVIYIAAGADHSFAIRYDGSLWAWGCNDNGQLGINSLNSKNIPVKVAGLLNVANVAAGMKHSIAVNQRGDIYVWGNDNEGQLGNGIDSNSLIPYKLTHKGVKSVSCGNYNTFTIQTDGSLWAWGQNNFGQLGDQSTENRNVPTKSNQYFGIKQVSAGSEFVSVVWTNAHSCHSAQVPLIMDSVPEIIISKEGMQLTCTQGQSYQWYFNGSELSNSNSQTITVTAEGVYSVEVFFENGCSAISDQFSFYLSIEEWFAEENAQIAPNPNNGSFELIINMPPAVLNEISSYELINISGSIIDSNNNFGANNHQHLNFPDIAPGAYYLKLKLNTRSINIKVFVTQ